MSAAIYGKVMGDAGKRLLYELDCMLRGEGDGSPASPFRLSAAQYTEARAAIGTLFRVFHEPQLEPHPTATTWQRQVAAKADGTFQRFMEIATRPTTKRVRRK
jgi:hypothetical protein